VSTTSTCCLIYRQVPGADEDAASTGWFIHKKGMLIPNEEALAFIACSKTENTNLVMNILLSSNQVSYKHSHCTTFELCRLTEILFQVFLLNKSAQNFLKHLEEMMEIYCPESVQ